MESHHYEKLKANIRSQQKKSMICFGKSTMNFLALLLAGVITLNTFGLGTPYIKDKKKKYCAKTCTYTNDNTNLETNKYVDSIPKNYEEENTLTVKGKYKITKDGEYVRKVSVYKLVQASSDNYQYILDNYQKYVENSKIDEYYEKTKNIEHNLSNKVEVNVKFSWIDKTDYLEVEESELKNFISSLIYTIFLFPAVYTYGYSLHEEYLFRKKEIDELEIKSKKLIKK